MGGDQQLEIEKLVNPQCATAVRRQRAMLKSERTRRSWKLESSTPKWLDTEFPRSALGREVAPTRSKLAPHFHFWRMQKTPKVFC